jgi:hypothetical protein
MGAGYYSEVQRAATMHGHRSLVHELYYGRDSGNFFLRLDLQDPAPEQRGKIHLQIGFHDAPRSGVIVSIPRKSANPAVACEIHREEKTAGPLVPGQAALGRIFEMKLPLAAVDLPPDKAFEFRVTLWENDLPVETLPVEGWLGAPIPV